MAHDPYYDLITLPPEPAFAPQRTALLTIDLQYLDAHPSGWMGRLCRDQGKPDHLKERFEFIQEILPNVRRLQDACREHGVEVIHIRVAYRTRNGRDGRRALSADLANVTLMDGHVERVPFKVLWRASATGRALNSFWLWDD